MTVLLQDRMIVQKKKKITVTTRLFINHVLQRKEKYHFKLLQDLEKVTIFLFILLNWFIKTFNSIFRSYEPLSEKIENRTTLVKKSNFFLF